MFNKRAQGVVWKLLLLHSYKRKQPFNTNQEYRGYYIVTPLVTSQVLLEFPLPRNTTEQPKQQKAHTTTNSVTLQSNACSAGSITHILKTT